ncbi:molybdenum cofactor biosynthesis protein MoaE [Deltaproteobacteria bacterium TL4]
MSFLTHKTIAIEELLHRAHHPEAGAVILFCGDVRNHNQGKSVIHLEYQAHVSMADEQIRKIVEEARQQWPLHYVEVIHRLGIIAIQECSVAIVVSASHRSEAYEANRFIIDTLKHSVPIWKKEYYQDGTSEWSQGCEACALHQEK